MGDPTLHIGLTVTQLPTLANRPDALCRSRLHSSGTHPRIRQTRPAALCTDGLKKGTKSPIQIPRP